MPAYVIFIRERTLDKSELEAYAKLAAPSLEGLPIKFLAAYGRQEVLEGPAPEGVAIANFRRWKRPSNGTKAPRTKLRHSIDSKARFTAASLLKALAPKAGLIVLGSANGGPQQALSQHNGRTIRAASVAVLGDRMRHR
jgi:hypothetical protein